MKTFLLAKQCIPLLDSSGQMQEWFLWIAVPVTVFIALPMVWRFLTGGNTRSEANGRAIALCVGGCLLLLIAGWAMSQVFDPTC